MEKANNSETSPHSILKKIKQIFTDKKCDDSLFMDLQDVNSYLTYFAIATAKTDTQARSVARDIEKFMKPIRKSQGIQNRTPSGNTAKDNSGWLLLDYGDIIVHIMNPEIREYYDLERLWGDAKFIENL